MTVSVHSTKNLMSSMALFSILFYTAAQLLANIASIKIGYVASFAVDMGVFLYPITFTLRDIIHREMGAKFTCQCIFYTVLINLFMVVYFSFISLFPADNSVINAQMFDKVLSPVWRLVVFSLLAQLFSELTDTEIYRLYVKKFKEKYRWGRVLVSNAISIPIDNLIFCFGAFLFVYDADVIFDIFMFNMIVKYVISLAIMPLIYLKSSQKKI